MTATNPRPLRRDAERNRRRILDAASELFTERGLGVTLDDIARHAEVGIGTAYRRFPDKQVLIDALFAERVAQVVDIFDAALADPDPWRGLVSALEGVLTLVERNRGVWELMMNGDQAGDRVARMREEIAPRSQELLGRAQAAGAVRADLEPTDLPLIQIMLAAVVDASRDVAPDVWRRYLQLLLDGLRPDRRKPTPLGPPALLDDRVDDAMRGAVRRR